MTTKNSESCLFLNRFGLTLNLSENDGKILAQPASQISSVARAYIMENKARIMEQLLCLKCSETNILSVDFLEPNHRLLRSVLFRIEGKEQFFNVGECVHIFERLGAAKTFVEHFKVWTHQDQWAAMKNQEKGYALAWIGGGVRGLHQTALQQMPYCLPTDTEAA